MQAQAQRGREAEKPRELTKSGWKDVLKRTKNEISDDNISIVAAGVAFYALLSIPALLTAVLSVYGLIASPDQVEQQIGSLQGILPEQARSIISSQLSRITAQSGGALTFAAIGSFLFALWSSSKAVKALMTSLNIAYNEDEKRGFFKLNATALALTLGGVIIAIVAIALVAAMPALIGSIGLPSTVQTWAQALKWPLLLVFVLSSLAVLYRYGPSRDRPKWRWVNWGATGATLVWLMSSALFSWYVSNFGSYNETYGSLGAVVVLLMWLYVSAFAVLFGAEVNSEMEHQTRKDTTQGKSEPMGSRGATMADTLGKSAQGDKDKSNKGSSAA